MLGIHVTKWLGTRLLLFLSPHKVGFLEYLYSYRMEFVQIKRRVRGKSSSFWWCKRYSAIWSYSWEHSKNVFTVNLGYRDNVHEFWQKTFSNCARESDQIAEKHLHHQKELDFPRTPRLFEQIPSGSDRDILKKNPNWCGAKNSNKLRALSLGHVDSPHW